MVLKPLPGRIVLQAPPALNGLRGAASPMMLPCGSPNWMCCSPPGWVTNPNNIVSCDAGWGRDVASGGWCTQPCGDPGQPCCDGPDTLAPRWTIYDGQVYVYSPEGLGPDGLPLKEMCRSGICDRSTHRCMACGTEAGKPCCPPDPNYGVARCRDLHLECQFDSGTVTSGTCASCGIKGSPPCYWGCDSGLGVRNGLSDVCGGDGQPPCDAGCNSGLRVAGGLCRHCGASGQIPCDSGCDPGLTVKNNVCTACGNSGQLPCDKQYPDDTGCRPGLGVRHGVCAFCGRAGQDPCDNGCSPGRVPLSGRPVCLTIRLERIAARAARIRPSAAAKPAFRTASNASRIRHRSVAIRATPAKLDQATETVVCDIPDKGPG
jgi:hypothetical protein